MRQEHWDGVYSSLAPAGYPQAWRHRDRGDVRAGWSRPLQWSFSAAVLARKALWRTWTRSETDRIGAPPPTRRRGAARSRSCTADFNRQAELLGPGVQDSQSRRNRTPGVIGHEQIIAGSVGWGVIGASGWSVGLVFARSPAHDVGDRRRLHGKGRRDRASGRTDCAVEALGRAWRRSRRRYRIRAQFRGGHWSGQPLLGDCVAGNARRCARRIRDATFPKTRYRSPTGQHGHEPSTRTCAARCARRECSASHTDRLARAGRTARWQVDGNIGGSTRQGNSGPGNTNGSLARDSFRFAIAASICHKRSIRKAKPTRTSDFSVSTPGASESSFVSSTAKASWIRSTGGGIRDSGTRQGVRGLQPKSADSRAVARNPKAPSTLRPGAPTTERVGCEPSSRRLTTRPLVLREPSSKVRRTSLSASLRNCSIRGMRID